MRHGKFRRPAGDPAYTGLPDVGKFGILPSKFCSYVNILGWELAEGSKLGGGLAGCMSYVYENFRPNQDCQMGTLVPVNVSRAGSNRFAPNFVQTFLRMVQ